MKIQKTEIMLYVKDTEQSMKSWLDQIGITEIEPRVRPGRSCVFAIIQRGMNVSFALLDQELLSQNSQEISCSTSSIMSHSENLQVTYDTMKAAGVFRM